MHQQILDDGLQPNARLADFCWILAGITVLVVSMVQICAMASLLAGRAGFGSAFPVATVVALSIGYWLLRRSQFQPKERWLGIGIVLLLLAVSVALSAFFFDLSWDGEWYHQAGIIHIAHDWNPLTDPMHGFVKNLELWERHYAKGPWYFAAAIYQTTGHIECGKAYNWLALAASFIAVFAACLDSGLRRRPAVAIAVVVALNPVVMSEVTTYLVDAVMAAALLVVAASLFTCMHRPSVAAAVTGVAAAIVAVNAKFTGLVFVCCALAAAALWCVAFRREWLARFVAVVAGGLFLAVCVWGYNPYVSNTIYRHQPFYPLLGSAQYPSLAQQGKELNERWETPKNIVGRNRFVRFGYSIFGRPGNQPYSKGRDALLMLPFTATLDDLYAYKYHETRVSGFGPYFSGALLLALGLALLVAIHTGEHRWLLALLMATVAASLLVSHQLWWPRYGPQLWLLPILPLAFTLRFSTKRWRRGCAWAVLCLLLVNAAIVAYVRLDWETRATLRLSAQLHALRDSHLLYDVRTLYFGDSWNVRLTEAGVQFRDVGSAKLPGSQTLTSVVDGYPMPVEYRPVAGSPATPVSAAH